MTAGATPFLADTLRGLAAQSRAPEVVLIVDVASRANGLGDGTPIEELVEAAGLDAVSAVRIVRSGEASTFGDAVARGLESYSALIASGNRHRAADGPAGMATRRRRSSGPGPITGPTGAMSPITTHERQLVAEIVDGAEATGQGLWLWLLHDDSAPEPDCLQALLTAAANARSVGIVGPKQVDWDNPSQLLEVGLRATSSARRANDIVPGEVDQGQYDDRSDVLAVGTAGALIARSVWEELGGTAPWLGPFGDGLELSRAARLAGYRVVVEPGAVIRHRRAGYLGLRAARHQDAQGEAAPATRLPSPDPERSYRARRVAQLTNWAAFSTRPVAMLLGWFLVLGVARATWRLASKAAGLASDEMSAALALAGRSSLIRAGRRRLAQHTGAPRSALSRLYVSASEIRAVRRDRVRQERERIARAKAPSELELRELAGLARSRRRTLAGLMVLALIVAGAGMSHLILTRSVAGGALTELGTWHQSWSAAWSSWLPTGDGRPGGPTPLLAILAGLMALAALVGMGSTTLVKILLLAAIPLAVLGAWFAAGTITRRVALRAWAALAWGLAPTGLLALGQGRLAPLLVHLVLPWALLALARAQGVDRRDVVVSGLVGAHLLTDAERAELDRFADDRIEDLAHLDEEPDEDVESGEQAGSADSAGSAGRAAAKASPAPDSPAPADPADSADSADSAEAADQAPEETAGASPASGTHRSPAEHGAPNASQPSHGPGSAAAAALAGLLLSVVVAAAPATAPILLLVLAAVALLSRRRLRLVLTAAPILATAAPAWSQAAVLARQHGWVDALRLILADAGAPLAASTPSSIDLLLGSPGDLDALIPGGTIVAVIAKALLVLVPLVGLAGLLIPGSAGARARTGILLALGGLALAALSVRVVTAVGTAVDGAGTVLVTGWAGTGLSLSIAGFLLAALAAADAALAQSYRLPSRLRRPVLAAACAVALLGPGLIGATWAAQASPQGDPQIMALRPGTQQIPLIGSQIQSSPAQGRVLILASTPQGLSVSVWRGAGVQMSDALPAVHHAQLLDRAGAALRGLNPPSAPAALELQDEADASLTGLVGRVTAGQDEDAAQALAEHGIAVIVLRNASGDEVTADARAALASTPGLEQLARTGTGTAWRVVPANGAIREPARLRLVEDGASTTLAWTGQSSTTVTIPAGGQGRSLVLAERADRGWRATLNGRPLEPATAQDLDGTWKQAFTLPAQGGELRITHASTSAVVHTRVIWAVWALTLIAALPLRRGKDAA
ncbi:glycosyltransferase [Actinomyces slackii]|uniref:glycosyltransferase n=1 Tax=Actinomyces slackii TaxID=52774 RepID=UPI002F921E5A